MKSLFLFAARTLALAGLVCGLLTTRTDAQGAAKKAAKAAGNPRVEMTLENADQKDQ